MPGTLSITDDGHYELWLSSLPNEDSLNCIFRKHYTIWGIDENDVSITLFNAIGHEFYFDMVNSVRAAIALIGLQVKLYYKFRPSTNPYDSILTRGLALEQLDALIVNWHKSYSTLRQVYISFERAGNRRDGIGGVPEFLHAEIALEGYYKRFHQNVHDEVPADAIVYCENILKELLHYYAPIDIVNKLDLNVIKIKNTRNAYVHLYNNAKQIYSEPYDLWVITEKLRVLAICCILHHFLYKRRVPATRKVQ